MNSKLHAQIIQTIAELCGESHSRVSFSMSIETATGARIVARVIPSNMSGNEKFYSVAVDGDAIKIKEIFN